MSGPAQRIGKYEVQALVAKGTRATVYRGIDTSSGQSVAIKVVARPGFDAATIAALRKFQAVLGKVRHPAIAALLDVIESEKAACVVSEFCEGRPLATFLKEGAYPEPKVAWDIARQLLEALAFAHVKGAVHRDLKPGNVMLTADAHVRIADFGFSLLTGWGNDGVHYRAPEQFGEGTIGPRTDIYQAGAIVYQLLTGKLPFTGSADEVAHRVLQERPSDPSSYNKRIAWQLDWVVQKALSKDPADRFGSAQEFADGLRLGLQDTLGRPLEPLTTPGGSPSSHAGAAASPKGVSQPAAPEPAPARPAPAPSPAPADLARKAQSIAARKPAAPPAAPPVSKAPQPSAKASAPAAAAPAPAAKPAPPAARPAPPKPAAPVQAAPAQAAPAPAAPAQAPHSLPDASKARVLFVDDDGRILNALRAMFRQEYAVFTAESGEKALELARRIAPHVVVSDQRMPGLTGVEVLRKVRTLAPNAVRILLTGYTDLAALVGSINEGEIFRFVKKPWENDELRKALAGAAKIAMELESTTPPRPASPRTAGSLLVIDPKQGLARGLERLLAGHARVLSVPGPGEAARLLQTEEIAAIVADLGAGMDGLVALFKQIKMKRPEILSILLADEPDSELGIELINKAHIFRFLPKPVSARELRTQVSAALRRYAAFKQIPTLSSAAPAKEGDRSAAAERARAMPDHRALARTA